MSYRVIVISCGSTVIVDIPLLFHSCFDRQMISWAGLKLYATDLRRRLRAIVSAGYDFRSGSLQNLVE